MKEEYLFERRIAEVASDSVEYIPVVFKESCADYAEGCCYVLTADELRSLEASPDGLPYIIDHSVQALISLARTKEGSTVFSRNEIEKAVGICWITQESLVGLPNPVLVDDGNVCEKNALVAYQDHSAGGFVASVSLSDRHTKLSIMIPHPIWSLVPQAESVDLTTIDQTRSARPRPSRIVTFMTFLDEAVSCRVQAVAPNHPGLIRFRGLISELYVSAPHYLTTMQEQYEFFSSREFQRLWNQYRRVLYGIEKYGHYQKYVDFSDNYLVPLLAAFVCPRPAALVAELALKCVAAYSVRELRPVRQVTNWLAAHFYSHDLTGNPDGLSLEPFLKAMREKLAPALELSAAALV